MTLKEAEEVQSKSERKLESLLGRSDCANLPHIINRVRKCHFAYRDHLRQLLVKHDEALADMRMLTFSMLIFAEGNDDSKINRLWRVLVRSGHRDGVAGRVADLCAKIVKNHDHEQTSFKVELHSKGIPKHAKKRVEQSA